MDFIYKKKKSIFTCFQGNIYNPRIVLKICPNSFFVNYCYRLRCSDWCSPIDASLLTTMDHLCQVCDKTFPSSSQLKTHIRKIMSEVIFLLFKPKLTPPDPYWRTALPPHHLWQIFLRAQKPEDPPNNTQWQDVILMLQVSKVLLPVTKLEEPHENSQWK